MKRALIIMLVVTLPLASALAQDSGELIDTSSTSALDTTVSEPETSFDFETIDVDGQGRKREKVSMADRMKVMRDRMEKRTADLVLRNIEKTRIKMELDMMKKINSAMETQLTKNLQAME